MSAGAQDNPRPAPEPVRDRRHGFRGWRVRIGRGATARHGMAGIPTPAVVRGRVLVGAGFGRYDVFALDLGSGEVAWHRRTRDDGPTAVSAAGRYAAYNTESCTVEVLDVDTGETVWSLWLGDPLLAQPALGAGRIFMAYPAEGTHWLGAFDFYFGVERWRVRLGHDVITAPVLADGTLYVSTLDGAVSAFDARTGEQRWRRDLRATSAPWVHDGEVYVAHRDDSAGAATSARAARARGVRMARERTSGLDARLGERRRAYEAKVAEYLRADWGAERKARFAGVDAGAGFSVPPASARLNLARSLIGEARVSRAWRFQGSRPVVADGVLYETTGDRLEARELATGALLWAWSDAEQTPGERRLTPPAVASGRVWAGTWDGRLLSWDARTGELRWAIALGAPCHWQPAVAEGRVLAGLEDGTLVCFETADARDTGWPMWGGGPGHNGDAEAAGTSPAVDFGDDPEEGSREVAARRRARERGDRPGPRSRRGHAPGDSEPSSTPEAETLGRKSGIGPGRTSREGVALRRMRRCPWRPGSELVTLIEKLRRGTALQASPRDEEDDDEAEVEVAEE